MCAYVTPTTYQTKKNESYLLSILRNKRLKYKGKRRQVNQDFASVLFLTVKVCYKNVVILA